MLIETKSDLQNLAPNWQGKPQEQVVEEIASYCAETNRVPDPYYFLINSSGELLSPVAGCKIKEVVERSTTIGKLEFWALREIENWVRTDPKGAIAWVSPPAAGVYPTSKVIISQIEELDGVKVVFNRAIVLDIDEKRCLEFARDLAEFSTNKPLLSSLHEARSQPIILNTSGANWTYLLEELIPDLNLECVRKGEDTHSKEEMLLQARKIYQDLFDQNGQVEMKNMVREVSKIGMVGEFSSSCPMAFGRKTAVGIFSQFSEYFCKKCPNCNTEINTVVKPGEECPAGCGAVRKCA